MTTATAPVDNTKFCKLTLVDGIAPEFAFLTPQQLAGYGEEDEVILSYIELGGELIPSDVKFGDIVSAREV